MRFLRLLCAPAVGVLLLLVFAGPLGAQGENNPTGVTGVFNGTVTTGGSYDPYTGNAVRTINDLTVPGAVSEIPLAFSRMFASRGAWTTSFGSGGPWRHSYEWTMTDNNIVGTPTSYHIVYPDGRDVVFAAVSGQTFWRGPAGTDERLEFVSGSRTTGDGSMRLHLGDGSKIEIDFVTDDQSYYVEGRNRWVYRYIRSYRVARLKDKFTRTTTLSYDAWTRDGGTGLLQRVTEPAGRFIDVRWAVVSGAWVIAELESSNRGTWGAGGSLTGAVAGEKVNYGYSTFGTFTTLTSVAYHYDKYSSLGQWSEKTATYTYVDPPGYAGTAPLLATAVDPRYPGAMTRIKYAYWPNVAKGFLKSENYYGTSTSDPDVMVSYLDVPNTSTRQETRGDGPSNLGPYRTFTYLNGRLASATNFRSTTEKTYYTYTGGYLSRIVDSEGRATSITREGVLGKVLTVLHEADNSTQTVTYTDSANPYFVASATDERGKTTTYTRNGRGQVTQITYPGGNGFETITYIEDGKFYLPSARQTESGGTLTFTYGEGAYVWDAWAWEESQAVTGGLQSIDPTSLLTTVAVTGSGIPAGEKRVSIYDLWGRPIHARNARGYDESFGYERAGRLATIIHNGTPYVGSGSSYASSGQRASGGLQSDSTRIWLSYDPNGNRSYRTDELGKSTGVGYDAYRRPIWAYDETVRYTFFDYSPYSSPYPAMASTSSQPGRVRLPGDSTNAPRQIHNYYTPDRSLQIRWIGANSADYTWVQFDYNSLGQVRHSWDMTGRTATEQTYDARGFIYEQYDSQRNRTWFDRDTVGNPLTIHLPDARTQTVTYDDVNRALTVTDQKGQTTTKTYFPTGGVATLTDPRLKQYTFTRDALGRQRTMTYPADGAGVVRSESVTFGLDGLVTARTDRNGTQWSYFEYDHRGRLFQKGAPSGTPPGTDYTPGREFNYDAVGRTVRLTNNVDSQLTWGYDDAGRTLWESQYHSEGTTGISKNVNYDYDTAGRVSRLTYPNTWTRADYTYTGRDQIASVNGNDGSQAFLGANFGYALDGQLNNITRLNGATTQVTFDADGRPASHVHKRSGTEFAKRTYSYDAMSRLTDYLHGSSGGANTPEDGRGTHFNYWEDGQIQTVWHDGQLSQQVWNQKRDEQFFYDANGNRGRSGDNVGWIVGAWTADQGVTIDYHNTPLYSKQPESVFNG